MTICTNANRLLADALQAMANLLESTVPNPYRVRAYRKLPRLIISLEEDIADRILNVRGAGPHPRSGT